jgi:hypothetical protein
MMLSCIEPTDPGYEKRSFSCAVCWYQYSIIFGIEGKPVPTRSPAAEGAVAASGGVARRDEKGSPMEGTIDVVRNPSGSDDITLH